MLYLIDLQFFVFSVSVHGRIIIQNYAFLLKRVEKNCKNWSCDFNLLTVNGNLLIVREIHNVRAAKWKHAHCVNA